VPSFTSSKRQYANKVCFFLKRKKFITTQIRGGSEGGFAKEEEGMNFVASRAANVVGGGQDGVDEVEAD
jgi:hypothetical protein